MAIKSNLTKNVQNLKENQRKLIVALIAKPTIDEACAEVGITTQTYYNWLENEDFCHALTSTRDEVINNAMNIMRSSMLQAVNVLTGLLTTKDENLKRKVAVDILNFALKWKETRDIEDRLIHIEKIALERRVYR